MLVFELDAFALLFLLLQLRRQRGVRCRDAENDRKPHAEEGELAAHREVRGIVWEIKSDVGAHE